MHPLPWIMSDLPAHGLMLALSLAMLWVIVSDAATYVIPNTLNLAIVALYGVAALLLPISPLPALAAAALVLLVGLGIFALGLMGGGDVKLLVALTLWTGWGMPSLEFLMLTALIGGALVVVVLVLRLLVPPLLFRACPTRPIPRLLTRGAPVPYGVAIALAFLQMLWMGHIPGLM